MAWEKEGRYASGRRVLVDGIPEVDRPAVARPRNREATLFAGWGPRL